MKPLRRVPKARQRLPFSKSIAVRKFATVRFYSRIHARKIFATQRFLLAVKLKPMSGFSCRQRHARLPAKMEMRFANASDGSA